MIGALVQLGVQRDDAAIGVLQLLIEPLQVLLARSQLFELHQNLLVLPPDLRDGVGRTIRRQRVHDAREPRRGDVGRGRGSVLPSRTVVPCRAST